MFKFSLVTPEKKFVTEIDVEEVIVPAFRGELDILPGHSPLVTTLSPGVLRYKEAGKSEFTQAALSWGYCEVSPEGVKRARNPHNRQFRDKSDIFPRTESIISKNH